MLLGRNALEALAEDVDDAQETYQHENEPE